jgi:hypothetical protein
MGHLASEIRRREKKGRSRHLLLCSYRASATELFVYSSKFPLVRRLQQQYSTSQLILELGKLQNWTGPLTQPGPGDSPDIIPAASPQLAVAVALQSLSASGSCSISLLVRPAHRTRRAQGRTVVKNSLFSGFGARSTAGRSQRSSLQHPSCASPSLRAHHGAARAERCAHARLAVWELAWAAEFAVVVCQVTCAKSRARIGGSAGTLRQRRTISRTTR